MNTRLQNTHQCTGGGTAEDATYLTSTRAQWSGSSLSLRAAVLTCYRLPTVISHGVMTPFPSQSLRRSQLHHQEGVAWGENKIIRTKEGSSAHFITIYRAPQPPTWKMGLPVSASHRGQGQIHRNKITFRQFIEIHSNTGSTSQQQVSHWFKSEPRRCSDYCTTWSHSLQRAAWVSGASGFSGYFPVRHYVRRHLCHKYQSTFGFGKRFSCTYFVQILLFVSWKSELRL